MSALSCSRSFVAEFLLFSESSVLSWSESSLMTWLVSLIRQVICKVGVPEQCGPSPVDTCRALIAIVLTLVFYYFLFGQRNWQRRRRLAQELQSAQAELKYLQEKLRGDSQNSDENKKEIRIFMDGAFDLMHFGHMNAFRLGKSLGTHLIVGVNSDESIIKCKGAPLMNDEERLTMVKSCKFVNEVVPDCPYIMSKEYLDWVIENYKIDYVIHGDDPCIVDGKDVYATAKELGKFRSIPRTDGVSTTDIVGRMLLLTKEHHLQEGQSVLGSQSKFLTTSRMLQLFSNVKAPTEGMRVIYIDGAWDLFHPGHVAVLEAARQVRYVMSLCAEMNQKRPDTCLIYGFISIL
jgi:ethanolamine-phosphate cytidylyltransferase